MSQELQTIKLKLMDKISDERKEQLERFAHAMCLVINDKCETIVEGQIVFNKMKDYFDDSLVDYINEK